ncbi:MAG: hypothetical protein ABII00_15900 [Elusimicrobiota bacterium]
MLAAMLCAQAAWAGGLIILRSDGVLVNIDESAAEVGALGSRGWSNTYAPAPVDEDGNAYFVNLKTGQLVKVAPDGSFITVADLVGSRGITRDPVTGDIFALGGPKVSKITPAGAVSTIIADLNAGEPSFQTWGHVGVDPHGGLWVHSYKGIVRKYASSGAFLFRRDLSAFGKTNQWFMHTIDVFGNFFVLEASWGTLMKIDPAGNVSMGARLGSHKLDHWSGGLASDADGVVYALGRQGEIWTLDPGGAVSRFSRTGYVVGGVPCVMAFGPNGNLYFLDGYGKVGLVTPNGMPHLLATLEFPHDYGWAWRKLAVSSDPPDADADNVPDQLDNCMEESNQGQEDGDWDGIGDACDCADDGFCTARGYCDAAGTEDPDCAPTIESIIEEMAGMDLPPQVTAGLLPKLENAIQSREKDNAAAVAGQLGAFINAVEAQRGKKMDSAQADALIEAAEAVLQTISDQ